MFTRRRFVQGLLAAPAITQPPLLKHFAGISAEALSARLAADPLRPQCHLLPARNWMNDPNGPIFWKGRYHMFFQYNPGAAVWGDMHWAHATSPDMVHWEHLPVALAPTPGWADADGCFTGSAVDDNGTAAILYTGVQAVPAERATLRDGAHTFRETQCLATSRDATLQKWTKWKEPVIQPPPDPLLTGFRDPFLWKDGAVWYLGVGSGVQKQGGRALLYRSRDLRSWEYLHPLASGQWNGKENINPVDSGEMWECPDFFALGGKHVLLYSTAGEVAWETGELDAKEMVFHSQRRGLLDHGAYYAQKTQLDAHGARILWGWIPERRPDTELIAAGWAGCMALPRELSLNAAGDLEMRVARAAEKLRGRSLGKFEASAGAEKKRSEASGVVIEGICGELVCTSSAEKFGLELADGAGAWWSLAAKRDAGTMRLTVNGKNIEFLSPAGAETRCRVILDASVAEFFCNDLHVLTTRIYRQPQGALRLQGNPDDVAAMTRLEAWQLKPISKDRLTT